MEDQELLTFEERSNATRHIMDYFSPALDVPELSNDEPSTIDKSMIEHLEEQADLLERMNLALRKIEKYRNEPHINIEGIVVPSRTEVEELEEKADLVKRKKRALKMLKRLPENALAHPSEKQV